MTNLTCPVDLGKTRERISSPPADKYYNLVQNKFVVSPLKKEMDDWTSRIKTFSSGVDFFKDVNLRTLSVHFVSKDWESDIVIDGKGMARNRSTTFKGYAQIVFVKGSEIMDLVINLEGRVDRRENLHWSKRIKISKIVNQIISKAAPLTITKK